MARSKAARAGSGARTSSQAAPVSTSAAASARHDADIGTGVIARDAVA